jgi:hypothetical protein
MPTSVGTIHSDETCFVLALVKRLSELVSGNHMSHRGINFQHRDRSRSPHFKTKGVLMLKALRVTTKFNFATAVLFAVFAAAGVSTLTYAPKANAFALASCKGTASECIGWGLVPIVGCAPEAVEGNLSASDRILSELARSQDFASATVFKAEVARTAALPSEQRISAYFKAVGVNPADSKEVAEFIGAREPQPRHLRALEGQMGLTSAQANVVAERLSTSLRGGLR